MSISTINHRYQNAFNNNLDSVNEIPNTTGQQEPFFRGHGLRVPEFHLNLKNKSELPYISENPIWKF